MRSDLVQKLLSGNRRALGQAITLVESKSSDHRADAANLLTDILPYSGKSIRIGISGTPGVGKSTFIESIGIKLIAQGHRIAVLAIDPSSPISSGSILGDKTRMQNLSSEEAAFIRPSPAGETLGGVARRTREAMLLCEAAGYNIILVETVGVGQSEYAVRSMVDTFVYLQLPNAGDELQGIKKGILELTNFILVNKSEGKNRLAATRAKVDLDLALNLIYQKDPSKKPEIILISSLDDIGIDGFLENLFAFIAKGEQSGSFAHERKMQLVKWYEEEVTRGLVEAIRDNQPLGKKYNELRTQVTEGKLSPISAAKSFINKLIPE